MTNVLLIEDQADPKEEITGALTRIGLTVDELEKFELSGDDSDNQSVEKQLANKFVEWGYLDHIDIALVDAMLSRFGAGDQPHITSSNILITALKDCGIPTLLYSKKPPPHEETEARYHYLASLPTRGGQFIQLLPSGNGLAVDYEKPYEKLVAPVPQFAQGFAQIKDRLQSMGKEDISEQDGPADVLAKLLHCQNRVGDFEAYTDTFSAYFGDLPGTDSARENDNFIRLLGTQIGYWLYNVILAFPGPILNLSGVAAFWGIECVESLRDNETLMNHLESARYKGPFHELEPRYWLQEIIQLEYEDFQEDLKSCNARLDDSGYPLSYKYCVVLNKPVTGPVARPDWIPGGAKLAFVERDTYRTGSPWGHT